MFVVVVMIVNIVFSMMRVVVFQNSSGQVPVGREINDDMDD